MRAPVMLGQSFIVMFMQVFIKDAEYLREVAATSKRKNKKIEIN
jgi:hypothetical protein